MSALGSLVVKLGLDYAQYTGGLDKSEQAALAAAKRIQDTFDGMKAKVAATAGAVAGGLAAGFTIAAFKGIISGAIDTGAALDDLRMQTGSTVEALSGLMAVGKFNNMGPEQIGAAMNKLSSNLASATEEGKGAGKALEALGIDFDKFKMMRPEDQMQTVAKAMAGFEDGTGKAAVAMALYGKQGAQMLPFLHDLAEVGELQAKVSTEQAAAAANLDDNLTRLSTSGEAWKKELANGMIPALDLGAQALVDMMNGSGGLRDEVRRLVADGSIKQWTTDAIKGLSYVADVGQIAWRVLQSIGKGLGGLAAALVQALSGDFRSAWATLQASGQDMIDVFDGPTVGARFRESLDKVAASAAATGDAAANARPSLDGFANTTEKAGKTAATAKDPFDALRDSIIKATAAYQAEAVAGEKLTEGQKKAIDVLDQLRTGKVKVTEAQAIQIGKDIEAMLAAEGENKAREEFIKTADAERAARLKIVQAMEQSAAGLEEQNRALRDEIELIGLTDAAQLRVLQQRNEAIILTKEATLAELERASAITGTMTREQIALQAEIEALRERNGLLGARYDRTATAKAAAEAAGEWTKLTDSVYDGLSDSLYRGFEAGKGFAKTFWDGLKNTAKTFVLKIGVQGIMTGVTGYLGLGGSAANAATGGGGGLAGGIQTASNLNSLWGAGSQALYGASAGASAASLGYANLVGAAGGDAIGALATANGMWAGVATGAQAAAQSAIAANLAVEAGAAAALPAGTLATATGGGAAAGGGIMGALNAIPGWGWALAGVALLGGMLSKKQTLHSGAGAIYSADQGLQEGAGIYNQATFKMGDVREYNKDGQALASGIAAGLGSTLDGIAKAFGQKAGYEVATAFADDTSKDGAWGALRISQGGKDLLNWQDTRTSRWAPKEFADGAEGQAQYLAAIANDTRQVLLDMDLPDWADTMLNRLGELSNMDQLSAAVAQIAQAQTAFEAFGQYMPTFAGLADSAISKLVDASGGVQALAGNMATFVDQYYTDAEKLAVNTENVRVAMDKLGFEMPSTRDEFAALVKANMALGDAGAKTVAGLLAVSGAFASVTQAAEAAAQAERERASALRGAFGTLADSLADMRGGVAAADARVAAVRMDIWSGYADAQQKVIDLEMQAADATRGFAQSLRGFVSDLATGPNSGMGLDARYQMLQQRFAETAARAGAGDQGARDALTGVASAYLDVARANARSGVEYARDAARVTAQLNKLASAAESDPLVQKYDEQTLTLQQQIADAQIDVVKHLALMEVAGVSTDLGIQTVDKTLQALRDEYVAATQEQAAANLKLDVALAALDALGLTEDLVKAIAANQTNSLSVALGISDEALASITGALGLTPENVEQIGQQFAVQVALLVGQAATDLAAALDGALAYDPAAFDALRTIVGYDAGSPDFEALRTILGFDLQSDKFRQLGTVLGMAPGVSAQVDALLGGIAFGSDAAAQAAALIAGIAFADVAREQIARIAAGVSLTDAAAAQVDGLNAGVAWAADVAAQVQALNTGVAWTPGAADQVAGLLAGLQLTDGAAAQVDGLNAGVAWAADVAAQVQALNTGVAWTPGAADQVAGLLAGLQLTDGAAAQVDGLLAGLQLAAADRVTVQQLLGGIGFDADTVTALQDGLGLRAGLLPTLGTALGLSDEAAKAIGVLSGMGTIDQTVSNAYASIGRVGIGSGVNQIDQQGWDFWRGKLATGELTLASFEQAFLQSAATTAREQQGSALSDYVSPYLKKLGLPGFAVGTSAVPFDMVAQIHQGEEITPRPYVDAQAADRREANRLLAEMVKTNADIKTEMAALKAELSAIKGSGKDSARVLLGIEAGVVQVKQKA